ncbi:UDP-glucuronate 4-epimerase [Pseudovibrio ascidiaceicola]|uniref:UDP-glucuronate 4-epimerase n=1 Tax=Pseudovibrio ascidiaceicola TaxID=285279 RepID=A0A1I4CX75_9HYPH|nr:NAD-dependent epimerase [Pseudovibrio ascidiaceicola]SFK85954.1 UDP-glucuronate 4-epimerase [Pseudovibrio ascidiaceicola]
MEKVLVTGTAGFIGNAVALRLLQDGYHVIGLDCVTDYYDVTLKEERLKRLTSSNHFTEERIRLEDAEAVMRIFKQHAPSKVIHLAAQAGVRYSLESPQSYVDANVTGFLSMLEGARAHGVKHLVYASTSSVYGLDETMPLSTHRGGNHPVSFYAATKKANEAMAHSYAHLFDIPCTGLRFFTVYGPWGRPDMALFKFTKAILEGKPVPLFNHGNMIRDFTYVDDIVEGIVRVANLPPKRTDDWDGKAADPATSSAPYQLFNIGNSDPVQLMDYLAAIEDALGMTAKKEFLPFQPGDVAATFADVTDLIETTGFKPQTSVKAGVANFVKWYRDYYNV